MDTTIHVNIRTMYAKAQQTLTTLWKHPVRFSLRYKITLPYILLAMLLAIAGAIVITRIVVDSVQGRFVNQLMDTGKLAADRVVELEDEQLATLRVVANTEGVATALRNEDTNTLRELLSPIASNTGSDVIEVLDLNGIAQLSLRHRPNGGPFDYEQSRGGDYRASWPIVQRVLAGETDPIGDKFADLVLDTPWGATFYIAGPIYDYDEMVGVALVGSYVNRLVHDMRAASGAAHVTLYVAGGQPLATTFPITPTIPSETYASVLADQEHVKTLPTDVGDTHYVQALLPFEARHGSDLGVIATALSPGYLVETTPLNRLSVTLMVLAGLAGVLAVGTIISQHITHPVLEIAHASREVAQGNLDQTVEVRTRDEVEDLAQAFNEMVAQLRVGEVVKDIFGRAVSPEVSQALIEAVSQGQVSLGGEMRTVSVLFSDIKSFTTFSERHTANQVVAMLNEFFEAIYPAISEHGGVINKFGGDSTMALFGAPIPQPDHAYRAVQTGLAMLEAVRQLNVRRSKRGEAPIQIGVGINTGDVVVGTVGSAERLEYTAIGDPVNVASRIEGLTRRVQGYDLLISQATLDALGPNHDFIIKDLGYFAIKGKSYQVHIYAVLGNNQDAQNT